MPRSSNQKLKILYLAQMLAAETDDEHAISLDEMRRRLA